MKELTTDEGMIVYDNGIRTVAWKGVFTSKDVQISWFIITTYMKEMVVTSMLMSYSQPIQSVKTSFKLNTILHDGNQVAWLSLLLAHTLAQPPELSYEFDNQAACRSLWRYYFLPCPYILAPTQALLFHLSSILSLHHHFLSWHHPMMAFVVNLKSCMVSP